MKQTVQDVCVLAQIPTDSAGKIILEDLCSYSEKKKTALVLEGLNFNNHFFDHSSRTQRS